ncbi:hypothetical protein SAMD00019534_112080 [Acytostelium subglobosum LB1]|uniref:hypothetical protein n=1 Tax=Acytostelium subglobosum LB1 TaxID=1410327 RepID=UPI0006447E10|nr:hypothetical protein SAMD00019534_112080 [Acytostelium subglobosum LB1]GAM28032.1 hypothetical protein SAMD00019534_112080 [Acytostelium subglobosum LB1]|eukprot:XP_012748991.1 hypothetical protein SAMD00019534_112080 [Acytostelium subglobosum LB1]
MDSKDKSNRPSNTAFKQQRMKAWEPILTPTPVIITFIVIGVIFIPIGAVMISASNNVVESTLQYDKICQVGTTCNFTMSIPKKMKAPVYMYYRLDNFYQNHRRYVKSRNDDQLRGLRVTDYNKLKTDCDPYTSVDGTLKTVYLPCGLIARSMFNDTFSLSQTDGSIIPLVKKGIAWSSDVDKKFKNPPADVEGVRIIQDFTDEDFIVWMRTAGLPDFRKLYRIINQDLPAGNVNVSIVANYPVESFDGKKYVVLSTATWIGGKNPFLGYAYIVVGVICFFQGIGFLIKHKVAPRKLGDTKYLEWSTK